MRVNYSALNGKRAIVRLNSIWQDIIATLDASPEIAYRIEKLILRLDVVVDKMFIKTVKANDILIECAQLTERLQLDLNRRSNTAFRCLTHLEGRVDDLVKKTHDFRIKAG